MKVFCISDIHTEFLTGGIAEYVKSLLPMDHPDVIILAGDIGNTVDFTNYSLFESLKIVLMTFPESEVIFVCGNHEYYCSSFNETVYVCNLLNSRYPKLHFLNNSNVVINGINFVGSTLWFTPTLKTEEYSKYLNDYGFIADYRLYIKQKNWESIKYLSNNVTPASVVVTHHAPLEQSLLNCDKLIDLYKKNNTNKSYTNADCKRMNQFYYTDCSNIIKENYPQLWVHGHTHGKNNYIFNDCRIYSNPVGYPNEDVESKSNYHNIPEIIEIF